MKNLLRRITEFAIYFAERLSEFMPIVIPSVLIGVPVVSIIGYSKGFFSNWISIIQAAAVIFAFSVLIEGLPSVGRMVSRFFHKTSQSQAPCAPLRTMIAFVPGRKLRQRLTKYLSDQEADIDQLRKEGRRKAALTQIVYTWIGFAAAILNGPFVAIARSVASFFTGMFTPR